MIDAIYDGAMKHFQATKRAAMMLEALKINMAHLAGLKLLLDADDVRSAKAELDKVPWIAMTRMIDEVARVCADNARNHRKAATEVDKMHKPKGTPPKGA